jgi:hypothetical protein
MGKSSAISIRFDKICFPPKFAKDKKNRKRKNAKDVEAAEAARDR